MTADIATPGEMRKRLAAHAHPSARTGRGHVCHGPSEVSHMGGAESRASRWDCTRVGTRFGNRLPAPPRPPFSTTVAPSGRRTMATRRTLAPAAAPYEIEMRWKLAL